VARASGPLVDIAIDAAIDDAGTQRVGRPQKVDRGGVPTRARLLAAATAACVEHGFEGVTVADIARRADVTTPALYNHFSSKSELMVEACRVALHTFGTPDPAAARDPAAVVRRYLSPEFADARVLQSELHLAALRHDDVRDLLAAWHEEMAGIWGDHQHADRPTVTAWFLLLLGLAQLDALRSLGPPPGPLHDAVVRMAEALFER
jgi:AcrR family transcriptional regulator